MLITENGQKFKCSIKNNYVTFFNYLRIILNKRKGGYYD
jgi:hypothetical protein